MERLRPEQQPPEQRDEQDQRQREVGFAVVDACLQVGLVVFEIFSWCFCLAKTPGK
jgi:hypothetical protein